MNKFVAPRGINHLLLIVRDIEELHRFRLDIPKADSRLRPQRVDKSSIGAYQFDRYADFLFICHNRDRIAGSVIKFGFKIKVSNGMVVDNLMFMARNRIEAEHKVKQIYRRCEIFDFHELRQIVEKEDCDRESARI